MQCARCHHHPFEKWSQDDYYGLTAFFVRLLDTSAAEFEGVERFFREVVDEVVTVRGFTLREMGRNRPEAASARMGLASSGRWEARRRRGLSFPQTSC